MAPKGGTDTASVIENLLEAPQGFEFFQAVRLLSKLYPNRGQVGGKSDPEDEVVRFSTSLSFAFPTSDIKDLTQGESNEDPLNMEVAFMGLASPNSFGALPLRYTEHIQALERDKNHGLRDFLDMFNHRFISLFYRAVAKHSMALSHEQEDHGIIEKILLCLIGMGLQGMENRLSFHERALLPRAGHVARKPISAVSLEGLISSYFDVKAEVDQFQPRWYRIEEEDLTLLGRANHTLGEDSILGSQVELSQFGFRVRLGPLTWKEYQSFLPIGEGLKSVMELIRLTTGAEFDFDVQLVLKADETPELKLQSDPEQLPLLGWSTWLKSKEFESDPRDAVFDSRVKLYEDFKL